MEFVTTQKTVTYKRHTRRQLHRTAKRPVDNIARSREDTCPGGLTPNSPSPLLPQPVSGNSTPRAERLARGQQVADTARENITKGSPPAHTLACQPRRAHVLHTYGKPTTTRTPVRHHTGAPGPFQTHRLSLNTANEASRHFLRPGRFTIGQC